MSLAVEKISDAELTVMKAFWRADAPLNVSRLKVLLQEYNGWESSTVKTLVQRLLRKGALRQEKREVYYYFPLISEEEYNQYATRSLIQKLYDGSPKNLVATLVRSGLSEEDVAQLRVLLGGGDGP